MSNSNGEHVPHHEPATFGNPDQPAEGNINLFGDHRSGIMGGPRNPVIESQFPSATNAPATDIGTQPFFWSSFNISPR